jgi:hypothetical protein
MCLARCKYLGRPRTHEVFVSKRSFIAGARSLNEQDLHDNLAYFKVPQAGIESIRSKLDFKIFHLYANILKQIWQSNNIRCQKETRRRGLVNITTHYYIHSEGGDQQVAPNPNPHVQRNLPHVSTR